MGARLGFLGWAVEQKGKPYIWGCKTGNPGYDCSGFVTAGLFACGRPDWRYTAGSALLWDKLKAIDKPDPGDLCFWGAKDAEIDHVMVWWGDSPGRVYGACGGGHKTTTIEEALRHNAKVQFRSGINYRPYFRGYRQLPLDVPELKPTPVAALDEHEGGSSAPAA